MAEPWVINASPIIVLAKVGLIERVTSRLLQIRQAGAHIGEGLLREAIRYAGEDS